MSDTVLYETDGAIATVTLNRPENMKHDEQRAARGRCGYLRAGSVG